MSTGKWNTKPAKGTPKLIDTSVLLEMAPDNVPYLSAQTTHTLPVLLVPDIPLHPSHLPPNTAQPHVARHTSPTLRAKIRSRFRR